MWASDNGVRTGLRLADVLAYLHQVAGLQGDERAHVCTLLQECEREALAVYAELREAEERERERKGASK